MWDIVKEELDGLNYELLRELSDGRSSNSKVWLAHRLNGDADLEEIAVKVSSCVLFGSWDFDDPQKMDEKSERELEIYEKLPPHPNIVSFKDFHRIAIGDSVSIPVDILAMEYVDSPNLLNRIRKKRKLSEEEAKKLLEGSLSGLAHVHNGVEGHQILHRDIRPSNILFNGDVKLFDFNFSKIGDATSASRLVENPYYPVDAVGKQTQSQDLVALANRVICAGYGLEIEEVRDKQGKTGLDPIDVDGLNFGQKVKSILMKLSHDNPALRYQTAEQALQDLRSMDALAVIDFDNKLSTVERSPQMQELLTKLKDKDTLFDYNVPVVMRNNSDDDALLEHLEKIYSQERFIVEGDEAVKQHIKKCDRVIKKDLGTVIKNRISKGAQGIVLDPHHNDTQARVEFHSGIVKGTKVWHINHKCMDVTGKRRKWLGDKAYDDEVRADKFPGGLAHNHFVEYTGDEITEYSFYVEDSSEGIVARINKQDELPLRIVWENRPGLIQDLDSSSRNHGLIDIGIRSMYSTVNLVKPNPVNFKQLYKECFPDTSDENSDSEE